METHRDLQVTEINLVGRAYALAFSFKVHDYSLDSWTLHSSKNTALQVLQSSGSTSVLELLL